MSCDPLPAGRGDNAAARANAYHSLALALAPPNDWPASLATELREGLAPLGGELADRADELADEVEDAKNRWNDLSVAYAKLFVGPFEVQAAPWASLYLDPSQQLMGEVSQYAAHAFAEAGLGPSRERKDAPDHIRHELEFMYYLAFQEATTGEPVWRERQQRFWNDHLGRWLPELANAVARARLDPYFENLAAALLAFARAEESQLGPAAT